jgi:hypothetical protein
LGSVVAETVMAAGDSTSSSHTESNASAIRPAFTHEALDQATDSFRLIKVLPTRSEEGHLQLSLWHDNISSASYRCVSYRWGETSPRHVVSINGKSFHVRSNLYHFLEEIFESRMYQDAALWIDSVSIDQSCIEERGHQVQQMGKIYTNAQEVLLWLGREITSARALCTWLQAQPATECPHHLGKAWDRIRFNPYWYRAWIVQEVLLNRCITVVLPGVTLAYNLLGRTIARFTSLERLEQESAAQLWTFWDDRWGKPHNRPNQPKTVDWIRHERNRDEFWRLIHMHRYSKCENKRDRVYSLLGLISGDHGFKVDYNETAADLFWRAGEHFDAWEAPEFVDILRLALLESEESRSVSPSQLHASLKNRPDFQVRIPVRRATPTTSLFSTVFKKTRCKFKDCRRAPSLPCTRNGILLCTNARSDEPTEHGCLHGLACPLDKPAAEPFEIRLKAHHGGKSTDTVLPPTALQTFDIGTGTWFGVSTWSSLRKALDTKDLDRADRVKLLVPAKYAIWIWFGVHPDQLENAVTDHHPELPSAHHALPPGTKVTRSSIEVPRMATGVNGETRARKEGIFDT